MADSSRLAFRSAEDVVRDVDIEDAGARLAKEDEGGG